jgi:hypothetical protein
MYQGSLNKLDKNKLDFKYEIKNYLPKIVLITTFVSTLLFFKMIIVTLSFAILEWTKEFIRKKFNVWILPIPFYDLGILLTAYYYPIFFPIILLPSLLIIKLSFGHFNVNYLKKISLLFVCIFIVKNLRNYSVSYVVPGIFLLRYIFDYILGFILGNPNYKDFTNRLLSTIVIFSFFTLFIDLIKNIMI